MFLFCHFLCKNCKIHLANLHISKKSCTFARNFGFSESSITACDNLTGQYKNTITNNNNEQHNYLFQEDGADARIERS